MSGNNGSTAETAQSSDQFKPRIHEVNQLYLQRERCQQQQQQRHDSSNTTMWLPNSVAAAELNDCYWQQQNSHTDPPQQQQLLPQIHYKNHQFPMTEELPPPPPQPALRNDIKRFSCGQQQQQHQRRTQQQQMHLANCLVEHAADYEWQQQQEDEQWQPQQHHHHHAQHQSQLQQPLKSHQQQREQKHYQHCLYRNQHLHQNQQQQQHQQKMHKPHLHYYQQQQQQHIKCHSNASLKAQQQDLVYSQKKIRKLRIILGVVFGLVVIGLLATALVFIIQSGEDIVPEVKGGSIHLDDVLSGRLAAHRFNASWSTGTNLLFRENNSVVEYDVKTGLRSILMHDEHQYVLTEKSADGNFLLLAKNYKKNFRHSFGAQYDVYDLKSKQMHPLLINGEQHFLSLAQWSPVGNALLVNFERNLYYKSTALADFLPVTKDAEEFILNGIPDWVYEEEVFGSNSAAWFSPNGTQIAFIQFDDSPTHVINFPYYGEAGDLRYQYPFSRLVAYPKAGSSNPRVKLFTADLQRLENGQDNHLTHVLLPSALNTVTDYLITVVEWLDNDYVLSIWMDRIQTHAYVQVFDPQKVKRSEIYNIESKSGWVDLFSAPFKNRDGSSIALILPQLQDDGVGYFRHLSLLTTRGDNPHPEALTKGKFEVQSILHWDVSSDVIFYTANTEANPEVLHVYAVKARVDQSSKCITCNLQISGGIKQTYYTADFNTDHQIVISSLGPGIPMTGIYEWKWSNNEVLVTKLIDWETNEHLRSEISKIAMPPTEIHTIPIANGFTAKVLLQLPPNLDRSGNTKYPMLVDVYGGPDSYSVVNKWILDWGTYLSSNQSVIYAKIDGRGSGLRGENLLHSIYQQLGTVEISDQIDVARQLQQKFPFIDANHSGIWGWSYGGYAAAMALANDNSSVYKCAASIAPVTDWAYYDSIYTERYMSLPKLNELGYANSRLSTRANQLRGKKFLLVHGTLDDNVHYQQAMILAKNLERHDILFKQISYPDEDHGLANVRPHLYHSLDRFFGECFARKSMMEAK